MANERGTLCFFAFSSSLRPHLGSPDDSRKGTPHSGHQRREGAYATARKLWDKGDPASCSLGIQGAFRTAESARPGPCSAPRTAPGLPPRAGPRTAQASCVTHQLLTCRMVSPVSCASCFFWSSEGYGCCSHQRELPGLPGCPLIPKAWPAQVPQGDWLAQVGAGLGEPSCLSFYAPRSPSEGGRAKLWAITLASPPPTPPHNLFQQLEANWPTLIREVELGLGGTPPPRGREAKPSTGPC